MGVLSCNRECCDNIMCDIYVYDVGYICNECRSEFEDYLECDEKEEFTEGEITNKIKNFMNTIKGEYIKGDMITISDFFAKNTR